jgi:predicted transcriptional regulator
MNTRQQRDFLFSIKPQYAHQILSGNKTVELRRRFTASTAAGSFAIIYSTSPERAIVGCARIKGVQRLRVATIKSLYLEEACILAADFREYFRGVRFGYAIFFCDPFRFTTKLRVSELKQRYGFVPPQSFMYLSASANKLLSDERIQIPHRHKYRDRA